MPRSGASRARCAALIVEPVAANMGLVPPRPGYLEGLRERTSRHGALLIFDEVISGFRVAAGGAQELYGVRPDLTTLGKILGGGLPVGAYGGRRDLMERMAPSGPVYQAGTLSGNPLAMSAGIAMLQEIARRPPYEELERKGSLLESLLAAEIDRVGVRDRTCVTRLGSLLTLFLAAGPDERLRVGAALRRRAVRDVLPRDARAGRVPPARAVRGLVSVHRALGRRPPPHGARGRREPRAGVRRSRPGLPFDGSLTRLSMSTASTAVPAHAGRDKHPRGLYVLAAAEMWERFSFYTMLALFTLYLQDRGEGFGWTAAQATTLRANYLLFVFFSPLIGGWLADRKLGYRRAVMIGGAFFVAGHILLAVRSIPVMYAALLCLVIGNGFFKPNVSTIVGNLYPKGSHLRDRAYNIFYMCFNLGAALGPIVVEYVHDPVHSRLGRFGDRHPRFPHHAPRRRERQRRH